MKPKGPIRRRATGWVLLVSLAATAWLGGGCSIPRRLWPQSDIESYYLGAPTATRWVLVASRHTDFKNAVIAYLDLAFREERERNGNLYVRFVGIEQLERELAAEYDAVVIINTCIAAALDRRVDHFLAKQPDLERVVVVTTSGEGDWEPCPVDYQVEAISAASKRSAVRPLVDEILSRVWPLLNPGDPAVR